ncbi:MAG: hypothetical protein CO093_09815 [Alphaproteobacteria bacterium CG_4_9_14_3_um_filter_47_13]|nr:MAG: hypothetical protein CO093_09815 [Alphaproteobacteria bacterium CG_4_9_14_3_um_filter_47_13]
MYSRLDPIFKTQIRPVESLDTRQAIRQQNRTDGQGKQHEDKKNKNDEDLWEDHTTLSTRAIKSFLEQLVKETKIQNRPVQNEENIDFTNTLRQGLPLQTDNSRAAQAYERTYRTTHKEEEVLPVPEDSLSIELELEEIRVIHKLIEDLERILGQHIESITLTKRDSFLQSLVEAVEAIKT